MGLDNPLVIFVFVLSAIVLGVFLGWSALVATKKEDQTSIRLERRTGRQGNTDMDSLPSATHIEYSGTPDRG